MAEFFFDVDDTLIYNQYMYTKAYANFIDFMLDKLNVDPSIKQQSKDLIGMINSTSPKSKGADEIIFDAGMDETLHGIFLTVHKCNKKGVEDNPANPYNKERVPKAFRRAYFEICKNENLPVHWEEANEAYNLGKSFHNVKKDFIEGAEDVLEFLKGKGCKMKIYTCGDVWLQKKKIEVNELDRYFDKKDQIIVPIKHTGEIKNYLNGCDPDQTFMVGNSRRNDIVPALEAGIRAIYFPSATFYEWDDAGMKEEHKKKVITIHHLKDIINNYDSLVSK